MDPATQKHFRLSRERWSPEVDAPGPRRARQPATIQTYVPAPLAGRSWTIGTSTLTAVADAEAAVRTAQAHADQVGVSTIAVQLLRSEAIASSQIEGVSTPGHRALAKAMVKREGGDQFLSGPATATIANLEAVRAAYARAADAAAPLTVEDLRRTHAAIAQADRWLARHAGVVRTTQNWIGPDGATPVGADFTPPAPRFVSGLLTDLAAFCSRGDLSPLFQASVAHAQYETIHPFADGNGRAGRVLIGELICRGGLASEVIPPTSLVLAGRRDAYADALTAWRFAEDGVERWITFLANAVEEAAQASHKLADTVATLQAGWLEAAAHRRTDAAARSLIAHLPAHPILTVGSATAILGRSPETARAAVTALEADGVLRQVTLGRRNRAWECVGLFAAVDELEGSLSRGAIRGAETR